MIPVARRRLPRITNTVPHTAEEWEFIRAIDAYKRKYRKMNPTAAEVLAVAKSLGYRKVSPVCEPEL
jgi:hypothetical protein